MEISTGKGFEKCIESLLISTFAEVQTKPQTNWTGIYGNVIIPDFICTDLNNKRFVVEVKWQQVKGTSEQKLIYSIEQSKRYPYPAILVLGGCGWSKGCLNYVLNHDFSPTKVQSLDGFFQWLIVSKGIFQSLTPL